MRSMRTEGLGPVGKSRGMMSPSPGTGDSEDVVGGGVGGAVRIMAS